MCIRDRYHVEGLRRVNDGAGERRSRAVTVVRRSRANARRERGGDSMRTRRAAPKGRRRERIRAESRPGDASHKVDRRRSVVELSETTPPGLRRRRNSYRSRTQSAGLPTFRASNRNSKRHRAEVIHIPLLEQISTRAALALARNEPLGQRRHECARRRTPASGGEEQAGRRGRTHDAVDPEAHCARAPERRVLICSRRGSKQRVREIMRYIYRLHIKGLQELVSQP